MKETVQKIPFLRLLISLATGILLYLFLLPDHLFLMGLVLFFLVGLFWVNRYYGYRNELFFGMLVHLFFISLGMFVFSWCSQKPVFFSGEKYVGTVWEIPQEKENSYQAVVRIDAVYGNDTIYRTEENIITWFEKNENACSLNPGDIIFFDRVPLLVSNNNNPYEFDYKGFLNRKKIYRNVYLPSDHWIKTKNRPTFSVQIIAERIRMRLLEIFQNKELGDNEQRILSALILGYKQGLDPETKNVFASAGAMHVLAVSGLHVGIVFLVLTFFLGFLRKQKTGRVLFVVIVILFLWFYAFLTGLSPSVTRAATMFSFVVTGTNIRRQVNIYNSLAASAFFLLLLNPANIFEVGFQLSYAAVFGIVFLQPRLENLVYFKYKIIRYFWSLFTVALAAQITTFPISLYYFNQFPVFFWLSNLFVIPAVTLLIPLGMALLLFHGIPFLSIAISKSIDFLLGHIFDLLQLIENIPYSLFEFKLLPIELLFIAGILFSVFLFIGSGNIKYFKLSLVFLLFFLVAGLVFKIRNLSNREIIVYNHPGNPIVHLISGQKNYIISRDEFPEAGYTQTMVSNTVLRYRLAHPVLLLQNELYKDSQIFMKENIICFEGRIFQFDGNLQLLPEKLTPEIVIGQFSDYKKFPLKDGIEQFVISFWPIPEKELPEGIKVYYPQNKGAFREKW